MKEYRVEEIRPEHKTIPSSELDMKWEYTSAFKMLERCSNYLAKQGWELDIVESITKDLLIAVYQKEVEDANRNS